MNTILRPPALALALLIACAPLALAESQEVKDASDRILQNARERSEIMANLEYLSDMIGPRLTGSDRLKKANEWTAQKMREYGLDNVRLEPYAITEGWERGRAEARLVEPNGMSISLAAMAWTPGVKTKGPVVYVEAKPDNSDLEQKYHGKLKNAIVLVSKPSSPAQHPSRARQGSGIFGTDEAAGSAEEQQRSRSRTDFFRKEGVAALLLDAGKPQMLLNMTGSPGKEKSPRRLPTLFVANEHFAMLHRLLARNVPVIMELRVESRFVKGPITVYNTVGEIRGVEKPDEQVVCGAHLDSWDLGQGTCDNGTGSMVALEAARLIKAAGLKPRRTIRFVLFSGEEQGLYGSEAYVKQHKDEMDKVSAVFVHDTGTGKVNGIGLHGNPQVQALFETEIPILKDQGVTRYSSFIMNGTDHASFAAQGVPGFWFMQDPADYGLMHHSQSDTFDKALKDDLIQGAGVMAICAYDVAQRDDMLPRKSANKTAAATR